MGVIGRDRERCGGDEVMKRQLLRMSCAVLGVVWASCAWDSGGGKARGEAAERDGGLEAVYRAKLVEIQELNGRMLEANQKLDFAVVHALGLEALGKAREAAEIARQVADPRKRSVLLAEVGRIEGELESVVAITGG